MPQRMQGCSTAGAGTASGEEASRQLVVLMIGRASLSRVKPIIGPPITRRAMPLAEGAARRSRSPMAVPRRASTLCGCCRASPVRVTTREIIGSPKHTARCTARTVPGLCTTTPTSAGRPRLGTSRSVSSLISCFSPPEGYLVGTTTTSRRESSGGRRLSARRARIACSSAMTASGLLSSIPIRMHSGPIRLARISSPSISASGCVRMVRSSAVM